MEEEGFREGGKRYAQHTGIPGIGDRNSLFSGARSPFSWQSIEQSLGFAASLSRREETKNSSFSQTGAK